MDRKTLDLISALHEVFRTRGWTLSTAESCTGGLISHYITTLPGASAFFEAGVVTYSAAAKELILGIPGERIASQGVVSMETAREMAERVRSLTGTDCSVSTTGNLGPDVLEGKEAGLVYMAVCTPSETLARKMLFSGDRGDVKREAARSALRFLLDAAGQWGGS